MAWPTLSVEIDFDHGVNTPNASATWTDITTSVFSFTTRRGRSDELGRIEAGVATVVLDNSDRRFDPSNTAGPYYGRLVPMRKFRIRATYAAITYGIFYGFIESWPQEWHDGGLDTTAPIDVVDAFKGFTLTKLNGAYASEYTNWSINTWLTAAAWPAADRSLSSGQSQIQAGTFTDMPALQHFQNVIDVESGLFYMSGNGLATFEDRHYRYTTTRSTTIQAQFDDLDSAPLPWYRVASKFDDTNIWNESRITPTGGSTATDADAASQALYFTRTYSKELPVFDAAEALSLAQWIISRYKTPVFRFTTITLDGGSRDALWPAVLAREISDQIQITARPPGGGAAQVQNCWVEGIAMDVSDQAWRVTLQVSPAADATIGTTYWILEDSSFGILDSTTRLAY